MFHKIKAVRPLADYRLRIQFCEGSTKLYDIKPLFDQIPVFNQLKDTGLFYDVCTDVGGNGIVWNDDIDLSCDELWENGQEISTSF